MVWSLACFWTWPGRTRTGTLVLPKGLSPYTREGPKDKGRTKTKDSPKNQKNPKNRKKWKTFPRSKNAQNSRQNTFAQQFGHRDLKWTAGCATEEKCPKRPFLHPKNGPFWTPQIGPRTQPDAQNKIFFCSCTDSSQLDLQRGHRVKKWKKMVRPFIFLKGPRILC